MLQRSLMSLLFLSVLYAGAQPAFKTKSDSLLFTQADSAFKLAFKNSDTALLLATRVLQQAAGSADQKVTANAWNAIGWALMHKGNLDSSVIALETAQELFHASKSESDLIRAWINLSEVYTKQNKIVDAIRYLTKADSLCTKTGNTPYQTNVMRLLGIVYREAKDYPRAAIYFRKALDGFAKTNDHFRYISTGISLSILYRGMGQMDSSLYILNTCLDATRGKTEMLPYQVAMVEEHLAETWFGMDKPGIALQHYLAAYRIFEKMNNRADLAFEAFSVGKTLLKLKQFGRAEKYLLQSYKLNDSLKMRNYQRDVSAELALLYQQTGQWQKAYQYLEKAGALKDSLGLAEQIEKTNELKEKFEAEKKEQEITLLKTKNQLADATSRRAKLLQYLFILLFFVSVVIAWLLLNRYKMKRKLQEHFLRNQIARDLHDDIGSALSSIDIGSRIALLNPGTTAGQLEKIQQHARKTMDSMSDIVWSINPQHDHFESMLMRMREFAAEICEALQIRLQFQAGPEIENMTTDSTTRKNIFLIYKEAVNNAAKYSGCSELDIRFLRTAKNNLQITITDNGGGFDEATVKKGNGLRNMAARTEQLGGRLEVKSTTGKGTSVTLECPV